MDELKDDLIKFLEEQEYLKKNIATYQMMILEHFIEKFFIEREKQVEKLNQWNQKEIDRCNTDLYGKATEYGSKNKDWDDEWTKTEDFKSAFAEGLNIIKKSIQQHECRHDWSLGPNTCTKCGQSFLHS